MQFPIFERLFSKSQGTTEALPTAEALRQLRKLIERQRKREKGLRKAIKSLDRMKARPVSVLLAEALKERDRQLADLQSEADKRLAELEAAGHELEDVHRETNQRLLEYEEAKREADQRQRDADQRLVEREATAREAAAIKAEAERRLQELEAANREVMEVRKEAELRATLLEAASRELAEVRREAEERSAIIQRITNNRLGEDLAGALRNEIESLRMQLAVMREAAEQRLVALEENARAVAQLRERLAERDRELSAQRLPIQEPVNEREPPLPPAQSPSRRKRTASIDPKTR